MKSILMSIKPKWCELIALGKNKAISLAERQEGMIWE